MARKVLLQIHWRAVRLRLRRVARLGNPINAATGNKFEIENDFIGAPNTGLSLTRYYNSADTTASAFGMNWHSTWHRGLDRSGNTVTVTRADGRQDVFTKITASIRPNPMSPAF